MWYKLTDESICHIVGGRSSDLNKFRAFLYANSFTKYTFPGNQNWKQFLQTGRAASWSSHIHTECPPYQDHPRAFKTSEGTICLTYQPYVEAVESIDKIEQWAIERGLKADVYGAEYSWYFPGRTLLIIIHLPNVEIKLQKACEKRR